MLDDDGRWKVLVNGSGPQHLARVLSLLLSTFELATWQQIDSHCSIVVIEYDDESSSLAALRDAACRQFLWRCNRAEFLRVLTR